MISEKRLHNNIKKMRKQLDSLNYFAMRNPLSMHWWEKWWVRKTYPKCDRLLLYSIVETVALDPRYRDGTWSILDVVLPLIKKGLDAPA